MSAKTLIRNSRSVNSNPQEDLNRNFHRLSRAGQDALLHILSAKSTREGERMILKMILNSQISTADLGKAVVWLESAVKVL